MCYDLTWCPSQSKTDKALQYKKYKAHHEEYATWESRNENDKQTNVNKVSRKQKQAKPKKRKKRKANISFSAMINSKGSVPRLPENTEDWSGWKIYVIIYLIS